MSSAITATGQQAKDAATATKVDASKVYLRLKDGESHRVRVLSDFDYVEYNAAGDFALGIYTQPITDDSPLLVAHAKGGEKFEKLYKKKRYVFAFASLQTGELVAWDASKGQAKALISAIEEYEDVLDEIAFTLKRSGSSTDTTYTLNPIIKMKPADKEAFGKFDGQKVEMFFYESIIQPKSPEFLAKLLQDAGFDTDTHLPHIVIPDDTEGNTASENDTGSAGGEKVDIGEDDLPF